MITLNPYPLTNLMIEFIFGIMAYKMFHACPPSYTRTVTRTIYRPIKNTPTEGVNNNEKWISVSTSKK